MSAKARGSLFGTDGVRGTANVWPMTAEVALQLGQAIAHVFRGGRGRHRILIGKDTRLSGYMFEDALAAGISSMGVDVIQVGPMPTPAMAFLTTDMRCDAGVMISASHNPFQDNGIKFFARDGFKLPDEVEARIEGLIHSGEVDAMTASPEPWHRTPSSPTRTVASWGSRGRSPTASASIRSTSPSGCTATRWDAS
jgi:phosphoglucosamine mutase